MANTARQLPLFAPVAEPEPKAKACPVCGCTPEKPCTVRNWRGSQVPCLPAGLYGRQLCSRCAP